MVKYAPISLQHQFFCAMDKGDEEGVFGPQHTTTSAWRVRGPLDLGAMQAALNDVVTRHSMLRTALIRGAECCYEVQDPVPVKLSVRQLGDTDPRARDRAAELLINDVEAGQYNVHELPHLRAFVGIFDSDDAVLVLTNHHVASDAWSMRLILRDLTACYAARKRQHVPQLPAVRQYPEYAAWQQDTDYDAETRQRRYWRDKLRGARMLGVRTNSPAVPGLADTYATYRFILGKTVTEASLRFAKATRSSLFMVTLAAYEVLLSQITGESDIVLPTFTSGRDEDRFLDTVGTFINFVPLRTNLAGCADFRSVLERTRATCMEAYTNDIPFAYIEQEAPDLMTELGHDDLDVIAFEVLQYGTSVEGDRADDLEYTEIRRRVLSQPASSALPDGALWGLDILPAGEMVGSLRYNSSKFDEASIRALVQGFERVLRGAVSAPENPLGTLAAA